MTTISAMLSCPAMFKRFGPMQLHVKPKGILEKAAETTLSANTQISVDPKQLRMPRMAARRAFQFILRKTAKSLVASSAVPKLISKIDSTLEGIAEVAWLFPSTITKQSALTYSLSGLTMTIMKAISRRLTTAAFHPQQTMPAGTTIFTMKKMDLLLLASLWRATVNAVLGQTLQTQVSVNILARARLQLLLNLEKLFWRSLSVTL